MKSDLVKNMDTNNELISVIIPMYNAESFIERCVSSVQNGIYQNIEILCVTGGRFSRLDKKTCFVQLIFSFIR